MAWYTCGIGQQFMPFLILKLCLAGGPVLDLAQHPIADSVDCQLLGNAISQPPLIIEYPAAGHRFVVKDVVREEGEG
jgi:hypothetical protein